MPKRLDVSRGILAAAIVLALSASSAGAQLSDGQWRAAPQSSAPRVGTEVKPAPTVVYGAPEYGPTVFRRQVIASTLVPAVIMSDGTVYGDFGRGYEPVYRSCSGAVVVGGQPRVVASNGVVINPGTPNPTHHQVPNQLQSQRPQMTGSAPAQTSCFNRDAMGRVFVYRR